MVNSENVRVNDKRRRTGAANLLQISEKECLTKYLTYGTIVGRMEVGLFFMPKIR